MKFLVLALNLTMQGISKSLWSLGVLVTILSVMSKVAKLPIVMPRLI